MQATESVCSSSTLLLTKLLYSWWTLLRVRRSPSNSSGVSISRGGRKKIESEGKKRREKELRRLLQQRQPRLRKERNQTSEYHLLNFSNLF